ncbi:MAG: NIPSNAP family protein [Bryobacteraceae bacterium]
MKRIFPFATFTLGLVLGAWLMNDRPAEAASGRVFEMRTYYTLEGRLDALNARFRNHTTRLFEKHGMKNIGYWVPMDEPDSKNKLVYLLSHESREQAKKSWDAFRADPDWKKAQAESEVSGKIVAKVESVFLNATDYSAIK